MSQKTVAEQKCDRRRLRSQRMLRRALAQELMETGDLSSVTVAGLTDRAGLTRRTFYSHYKDIPDFIEQVEASILDEVGRHVLAISTSTLDDLYRNIHELEPASGSVELLSYLKEDGELIGALMGPGGDPAFIEKLLDLARARVRHRMETGIVPNALGTFFDYYLDSVITSELGVIRRWFKTGLKESPETMARIMTVIAFVRPGDLYGKPIDINVPEYGMKLLGMNAVQNMRSVLEVFAAPRPTAGAVACTDARACTDAVACTDAGTAPSRTQIENTNKGENHE